MNLIFARRWKPLAARGIAGLVFGAVALFWPSITLAWLVLVFGAYALVDGVLALAAATRHRAAERVSSLVLEGLIGVAIGFAAILWTGPTAIFLVRLIALWALLTGGLEVGLAIRLRREIPGELLLALAGGVSLLLGILMLAWPTASAFVIVVLLGCNAVFFGASMLALAIRVRRLTSPVETATHGTMT